MRNRAKCKPCGSVIESLKRDDIVTCKCGRITIEGGPDVYLAYAVDFGDFLRIDDEGNEIPVRFESKTTTSASDTKCLPVQTESQTKRLGLLQNLDDMMEYTFNLPTDALFRAVTHADLYSFGTLVLAILRSE